MTKLTAHLVEKPWGRTELPAMFDETNGRKIGELWFDGPDDAPLLVKYLFTSERLSVQVHPNDEQARARGLPRGKSECWYVVEAEPGASIGLGLKREVEAEELRAAAINGSIVELLDWRPVEAGDFLAVPAGTIHAIGGGISLVEIQQNSNVTYRLYDYGRPRELHLEDALAVANRGPYPEALVRKVDPSRDYLLVEGPPSRLVHSHTDAMQDRLRWVIPLEGEAAGECLLLEPGNRFENAGARMLIASSG
jgi:mannose-6-phosphate isomerase